MILDSFAICSPGQVRQENQDNLYINGQYRKDISDNSVVQIRDKTTGSGLYAVADGMGGEKHGELASLIAVQNMESIPLTDKTMDMCQYLVEVNNDICTLIKEKGCKRIGSTFAGLSIFSGNAVITNIGDSRIYIVRGGELKQLSHDHTSIQQMIDIGIISKETSRVHPDKNMLTQHLGIFASEMLIEPYTIKIPIFYNDIFLLCSDGLTDMLDDLEIRSTLELSGTLQGKADMLYERSMHNGGRDNITIILVQIYTEN